MNRINKKKLKTIIFISNNFINKFFKFKKTYKVFMSWSKIYTRLFLVNSILSITLFLKKKIKLNSIMKKNIIHIIY